MKYYLRSFDGDAMMIFIIFLKGFRNALMALKEDGIFLYGYEVIIIKYFYKIKQILYNLKKEYF